MERDDERDEIAPHEFAQVVAGRLGLSDDGNAGGFADGPAVEVVEDEPEELDTDSADGVTEDEHGRLHGPDGKFVAKAEEAGVDEDLVQGEQPDEELEPEELGEEPAPLALEVDDPDVQAFLAKYDNDPVKALRAATEAQSLIGRQGTELSQLRPLQDKLEQLEQLMVMQMTDPRFQAPVDWQSEIESNPQHATKLAYQRGDGEAYGAALDAWMEDDPRNAATFHAGVLAEFQAAQAEEQAQPAPESPAAPASDPAVDAEVAKVVQRHPDLEKFLPAIGQVANERPYLKEALEQGTPQSRAQALEDLYLLARARDTDTLAQQAAQAVTSQTKEAASAARKGAQVVSARRSSAASAQPTRAEEFRAAFRTATGLPDLEVE